MVIEGHERARGADGVLCVRTLPAAGGAAAAGCKWRRTSEGTFPWPTTASLEAWRAPAQPGAQPWQVEGLVRR